MSAVDTSLCLQDFRPRMMSTAQQTEQQLAKASSVTSLAPKPKGKAAKAAKGKPAAAAAATKTRKGDSAKKSGKVAWDAQKRRSLDRAPSGRQFANAARLHQVNLMPRLHVVIAARVSEESLQTCKCRDGLYMIIPVRPRMLQCITFSCNLVDVLSNLKP